MSAPAPTTDGFAGVLGARRGDEARPRFTDPETLGAFALGHEATSARWRSRAHPGQVTTLHDHDGVLHGVRTHQTVMCLDSVNLPKALPPASLYGSVDSLTRAATGSCAVRDALADCGHDRGELLDRNAKDLSFGELDALDVLAIAGPAGLPVHELAQALRPPAPFPTGLSTRQEAARAALDTLTVRGLAHVSDRRARLSADGSLLAAARRDSLAARAAGAVLPAGARRVLAELDALPLNSTAFRVTVGDGCALNNRAKAALTDAGAGGMLAAAQLALDDALTAKRVVPCRDVRQSVWYALLAILSDGVLDERDRRAMWNPWLNATWNDIGAYR